MNYVNHDDVLAQLKGAGLIPDEPLKPVSGSKSRRCKVEGGDNEKRGWYRLYEWVSNDGDCFLTGSFGVYHGTDPGTIKVELSKRCESCGCEMPLKAKECPRCRSKSFKRRELSREELDAIKARQAEDKKRAVAERNAEIRRAADWARAVWSASKAASVESHDYFGRKQLQGAGGTRIFPGIDGIQLEGADREDYKRLTQFSGAIVVPMCDAAGRIFGVQFILSHDRHADLIKRIERDKEYWPAGLSKDSHYWMIGTPGFVIMQAEGYATAQSLHDATGHAVAVTFDAGNQPKVSQVLRKQHKRSRLLICGDDDWLQKCRECKSWTPVAQAVCRHCGKPHGKQNAGKMRAQEAAIISDGAWMLPAFTTERPADKKGPTDFNDLACLEGLQAVRAQIEAKLSGMGVAPTASASSRSAGDSSQGGGDSRKHERPNAVSVLGLDDSVERFVPLDDGTGKYLFDYWTNKVVLREQMLALLPAGVRGDDIKRHPVWASRGAFYFDQVGFDPTGVDKDVKLNTWQGWPMEPKKGCCEKILELVDFLCCQETDLDGNSIGPQVAKWLLRWMAYPLQNPGAKMSSAVIMHGPQGTGKSTVFQLLAKIYGEYATVLNQRGLEDKFNADWVDCKLFLLAEEVVTRHEMWHIKNELKELVTGDKVRVNGKNVSAFPQKNQINIALLSNENQPLPLDNDDRRHLVVYTPPAASEAFYDDVHLEIESGGVEAFYHYLLNLDLGDFHPKKRPPLTRSKQVLIDLTKPSELRFVEEWMAGQTIWPFGPCATTDLYAAYLKWADANGERYKVNQITFVTSICRTFCWNKGAEPVFSDLSYIGTMAKRPTFVFPDAAALASAKVGGQPAEKTRKQYLTDCFFAFRGASEDK